MSTITDALTWRYATKAFDLSKKIPDADLQELLEVLRLSPSSYGLQPWKFLVVTDSAVREKLKPASWNQPQITDASHLIVLCAKTDMDASYVDRYVEAIAKQRGMTVEDLKGYRDMMAGSVSRQTPEGLTTWNQKQVYIALGMLMMAAAQMKIDTCPMEGFDAKQYDEILGLKGWTATVLCPVGYRAASDDYAGKAKVRFGKDEVVELR